MAQPTPPPSPAADVPAASGHGKTYSVGTLTYTRGALLTVLFWMLWADLCLQILESLPVIIPIQMKAFGASTALTCFVKDTLMALLAVCFVPIIGMQSDRHRGPLGRRRPFLLWCTLPVCAFLIALGYVNPISEVVLTALRPFCGSLTLPAVGLTLIIIFVIGFFFFNNYILQVYQYMIADVVPREVMGKFVGFYRAIGALAGFIFSRYVMGYTETHPDWIYTGCSLFYALGFFLLVWRVKEGEYPPVVKSQEKVKLIDAACKHIRTYAKECYSHSFYWKIFLTATFYFLAIVPFNTVLTLYATQDPIGGDMTALGMSMKEFGDIRGWTFIPMVVIFASCGFLIDRFHALRVLIVGLVAMGATFFVAFFLATTQPYTVSHPSTREICLVTASPIPQKGGMETKEKVIAISEVNAVGEKALAETPAAAAGTKKYFKDKLVTNPAYDAFRQKPAVVRGMIWIKTRFTKQPLTPLMPSEAERILVTETVSGDGKPVAREEAVVGTDKILAAGKATLAKVPADAPAGTTKFFQPKYTRPAPSWLLWWWVGNQIALAIAMLAYLAMLPVLFPREKYGQFFSANQLVFSVALMVGPLLCGWLLDVIVDYRYVFVWSGTWLALSAWMAFSLFRHWQRLGGEKGYQPPGV